MSGPGLQLPKQGRSRQEVIEKMKAVRSSDVRWQQGKAFSLVYDAGAEVSDLLKEAYLLFFSENGLNPAAFPSLRRFETEVVAMAAALLGGDGNTVGNMTSGGTESILLAVKTARDWARRHRPDVSRPEILMPASAHPAFLKAAHYLDVRPVLFPVGEDYRANPQAVRQAVSGNTILLVGSAPSYPHGVVDPIDELAALAQERGLLCHVDACVGGFFLPFASKLGYPVPAFDFRIPGVTSISADLHKFAYAAKGASVILYRNPELRRRQFFIHTDWSGGIYPSPTFSGTRPGGAIAAAWAVLNFLGEEGYLEITATVMDTVTKFRRGIESLPDVHILGDPEMSILALASDTLDIYQIGDELGVRGWHMDRQQFPPSLHLTINHAHTSVMDGFLNDLAQAVRSVRRPSLHRLRDRLTVRIANLAVRRLPEKFVSRLMERSSGLVGVKGSALPSRTAAMYGMMGSLPNRGDVHELVTDLIDGMTRLQPEDEQR